jgi:hypothetical protein
MQESLPDPAIARGELAGIEAARLAHQLQVCLVGASLVWSVTGQGTISDELLDVANQVLAPYLHTPAAVSTPNRHQRLRRRATAVGS